MGKGRRSSAQPQSRPTVAATPPLRLLCLLYLTASLLPQRLPTPPTTLRSFRLAVSWVGRYQRPPRLERLLLQAHLLTPPPLPTQQPTRLPTLSYLQARQPVQPPVHLHPPAA